MYQGKGFSAATSTRVDNITVYHLRFSLLGKAFFQPLLTVREPGQRASFLSELYDFSCKVLVLTAQALALALDIALDLEPLKVLVMFLKNY